MPRYWTFSLMFAIFWFAVTAVSAQASTARVRQELELSVRPLVDSSATGKAEPQIRIRVENSLDARISINAYSAVGKLEVEAMPPGTYVLEVRRRDYRPLVHKVAIRSGFRYEIHVQLVPLMAKLELLGPTGTVWTVDDESPETDGRYRVWRGGSWYGDATFCIVAIRFIRPPYDQNISIGFRVVRN